MDYNIKSSPTRVVLNFAHQCALSCEWCYVPFGPDRARRGVLESIIDRIAFLHFSVVTFGGGDPFQYAYIGALAERAKAAGLYVHIDTHGKSMRQTTANELMLRRNVDLLGLPLDGPCAEIHDSMRSTSGHFELVVNHVQWLSEIGVPFKINTMVSRANVESLLAMGEWVAELNPIRWSIYQYMPVGPGSRVSEDHLIDISAFKIAVKRLSEVLIPDARILIEAADMEDRRQTYPIVHHDGSVFVHSDDGMNGMSRICSIFDSKARSCIDAICRSERSSASTRYRPRNSAG